MHPGLHALGCGVCLGQKGRVLPRRMAQPRVGGVYAGENSRMASLSTLHSGMAAWLMSSSKEGQGGISRLCRVSRVCANNYIRAVEALMWELERTWDSAINFINKYYSASRDKREPHLGVFSNEYNQPNTCVNNLKKPRRYRRD